MAEPLPLPAPDESLQYAPGEATPTPPTPPPTPPPPELQEVTVGGQTMRVSPDVAAVIQAQQEQYGTLQAENERLSRTVNDMDQWRRQAANVFAGNQAQPQAPDYSTLLYTDPNAAFTQLRNEIVQDVRTMYTEDQAARNQQQTYRDFMTGFYQANQDLVGMEAVVDATLNAHAAEWGQLPLTQVGPRLAEASRAQVLTMVERFGGNTGGGRRGTLRVVEGGGGAPGQGGSGAAGGGGQDEEVDGNSVPLGTLADDIRAFRQARKTR